MVSVQQMIDFLARAQVEMAKGRDGREQHFALVSVSLGVTFCQGQCTLQSIGERAAEIKHFAKSYPGNSYVLDRRSPLGMVV